MGTEERLERRRKLAFLCVFFVVFETKGLSLEEIDAKLNQKVVDTDDKYSNNSLSPFAV